MRQPRVAIIVSTYNGERFLSEQLDSLLAQTYSDISIFVRDDGSTDSTKSILEIYSRNHGITCWYENNIGSTLSFLDGLVRAGDDYDYYAFCDQDDVWFPEKVSVSVSSLEDGSAGAKLFFSEFTYCDARLHERGKSHLKKTDVSRTLFYFDNVCSGNTMLFNNDLRTLVLSHDYSSVYYHDWWIALIAAHFGNLYYSDRALLYYRRTGENVSSNGLKGLALNFKRFQDYIVSGRLGSISRQLRLFYSEYGSLLCSEDRRLLEVLTSGSGIKKAISPIRYRQLLTDDFLVRVLLLAHQL